jgi:transmembrane sensor
LNHPERGQVLNAGGRLLSDGATARAGAIERLDPEVRAPDWTEGWIDADNMSLADLLIELKRRSPGLQAELADPALSRRRISGRFAASRPQDVLSVVADMQDLTLRRDASGRLLIDR